MTSREGIRLHNHRRPQLAIVARRRIAFDRASGTTRRNSRKPRACRRSRIALIRSAAAIVFPMVVTRDSVTRYDNGGMKTRSQRASTIDRAGGKDHFAVPEVELPTLTAEHVRDALERIRR